RFGVRQRDSECALTIFGGANGESEAVLDELRSQEKAIEARFGGQLEWLRATRSHVRVVIDGGYLDQDRWPALHEELASTMARFVNALSPVVANLKTRPPSTGILDEDGDVDEDAE